MNKVYVPIEVLTFNNLNLIVMPFGKMLRMKIPFRFDGKWYRRTAKTSGWCKEIKLIINDNELIMLDIDENTVTGFHWKCSTTIQATEYIATFKEYLTKQEQKYKVTTLKLE